METIADFLLEVRKTLRLRHYSIHTEKTYLQTIQRFILFHGKRHPSKLGAIYTHVLNRGGHAVRSLLDTA